MLYPQNNQSRTVFDLSGIWEMKADPDDAGHEKAWMNGFEKDAFIGIPGSWNEQLAEIGLMNYVGKVWFQTTFFTPDVLSARKLYLRIGSADFRAETWVNGKFLGEHVGGYLPFEFDITSSVKKSVENMLVICVDNRLSHDTIPQGISKDDYYAFNKERQLSYPSIIFDFFAYGGIHRPVKIMSLNNCHLKNINIETKINGTDGIVRFKANYNMILSMAKAEVSIWDKKKKISQKTITLDKSNLEGEFTIQRCTFWCPENPYQYRIHFNLLENDTLLDEYSLEVGVREIEVKGRKLLLNKKPIFLKGFGKHEDFAVIGKGLSYPLIVKDFQLMEWIGANSFRTSHYPYAEEIIQMADKRGIMVIDEVPACSLNFKYVNSKTLKNHKQSLTELIARDRNHPSVISWSIANEPGIWGEEEASGDKAVKYWNEIYEHVKNLDPSRPITLPACVKWNDKDLSYKFSDFISINRYWGWYEIPGDLDKAGIILKKELKNLFMKYQKPILLSEFGADTIEGEHSTYPQMFTEEYQTMLIKEYFKVIESLPFTVGEHIWNFADFRKIFGQRKIIAVLFLIKREYLIGIEIQNQQLLPLDPTGNPIKYRK